MKNILPTKWSPNLAYVVGLIAADGCLSSDGRHIDFTSKDLDQIQNFMKILQLTNKIGTKSSGFSEKRYYTVQFGNVKFYRFLLRTGLTPHKSKTLGRILMPDKYFRDFLRGHLDGDGCTYSYWDPRWKSSFMFYTNFMSASEEHLRWIKEKIQTLSGIAEKLTFHGKSYFHLRFAKKDSVKLMEFIYYKRKLICLERKRFKIEQALGIIRKQAGMLK